VTYSFEIAAKDRPTAPPFSDKCQTYKDWSGVVVPYATTTEGDALIALYRHRRCGHQWSCHWLARWDNT